MTLKMARPLQKFSIVSTALFVLLGPAGCVGGATVRASSDNHDSRVSVIVIHYTTENFADSYKLLSQGSENPVSSHYLIPELNDETYGHSLVRIVPLVAETRRAWHAGVSYWAGKSGLNDQSIGIELVNRTHCRAKANAEQFCVYKDFDAAQISSLVELLSGILERHPGIKPTHIVGHSDIAPGRKYDPGPRFPWQQLAAHGLGAWFDDEKAFRYWQLFSERLPSVLQVQTALRTYGYEIEITGINDQQTADVISAFQLHFSPNDLTGEATPKTVAILFALIDKYMPEQLDQLLAEVS